MSFASGTWRLVDSQNFDEYMKALGVGLVMRKMGNLAKPTQEIQITDEGSKWNIKTITTFKTTELDFKLGQEFDEVTADGRQVKANVTLDGQKLTHEQKGTPDSTITREFQENKMTMKLTANGVTCTRFYEKVEES